MTAVTFIEQTGVLTADDCFDLPVFSNGEFVVSKWMPDKADLEKLNNGEGIYLFVISGPTQPPVNLIVGSPFIIPDENNEEVEV